MTDTEILSRHFLEMPLTEGEKSHDVWRRLMAHVEAELLRLRTKNDDPALPPEMTQAIRGHIRCLKSLRDLGKTPPVN